MKQEMAFRCARSTTSYLIRITIIYRCRSNGALILLTILNWRNWKSIMRISVSRNESTWILTTARGSGYRLPILWVDWLESSDDGDGDNGNGGRGGGRRRGRRDRGGSNNETGDGRLLRSQGPPWSQ